MVAGEGPRKLGVLREPTESRPVMVDSVEAPVHRRDRHGDHLPLDATHPYAKMTFASRMQQLIYWGFLKKPLEWSLKTVLAPWAYLASVAYHDSFWYPLYARRQMRGVMESDWGRLFANWEQLSSDERGYPDVGAGVAEFERAGLGAFLTSLGLLIGCLREAPEFAARRRTRQLRESA